jgi:hypothetical protein
MTGMDYESTNPFDYRWTQRAFDLLIAGEIQASVTVHDDIETVLVTGPCPRCGDHFSFDQVRTAVTVGVGSLGEPEAPGGRDPYREVTVPCGCQGTHEGRPDEKKEGCGVAYKLRIRATGT